MGYSCYMFPPSLFQQQNLWPLFYHYGNKQVHKQKKHHLSNHRNILLLNQCYNWKKFH